MRTRSTHFIEDRDKGILSREREMKKVNEEVQAGINSQRPINTGLEKKESGRLGVHPLSHVHSLSHNKRTKVYNSCNLSLRPWTSPSDKERSRERGHEVPDPPSYSWDPFIRESNKTSRLKRSPSGVQGLVTFPISFILIFLSELVRVCAKVFCRIHFNYEL